MFAITGPGGVLWNPQQMYQQAANAVRAQNPNGYGQAPGTSNRGYYEQQTPVGSFAAADQQRAGSAQAGNPYIGQTLGQSVVPYAQQIADRANQANPYLGQQSQQSAGAGTNPYAGANPYLEQSIDSTVRNATRGFNEVTNPQFDRMAVASGSFGNTGVESARTRAMQDFGQNLAGTVGNMRMQDYGMQQQLAEAGLNRTQQNNQFNAGLSANDLSRNLLGSFTQAGQGIQGLNSVLNAAQFDAGMGQADLSRNANLAQNMGQFNAGAFNQNQQFNAGQGNAMNMFNVGQGNQMLAQQRNLGEQARQYDNSFDYTAARNSVFDPMQLQTQNLQNQYLGLNMANLQQMQPLQLLQALSNIGVNIGGQGTTQTQNLQGNQVAGAAGGALTWQQLYNQIFGGS